MSVEVDTVRSVEVPTRIVHGPGAVARLGELCRELGIARPLLVTDKGVLAAGLVEPALALLGSSVPSISASGISRMPCSRAPERRSLRSS